MINQWNWSSPSLGVRECVIPLDKLDPHTHQTNIFVREVTVNDQHVLIEMWLNGNKPAPTPTFRFYTFRNQAQDSILGQLMFCHLVPETAAPITSFQKRLSPEVRDRRSPECVKRWPECADGEYNPDCCRWPKSCSCES